MDNFKPMLLSNDEYDLDSLDFTSMYASSKRDGVRAVVTREGIKNRSLKVLRNINIQEFFKSVYENLPEDVILEAEIHSDTLPCREIAGLCNSKDHDVHEDLKLYIFGVYDEMKNYTERMELLQNIVNEYIPKNDKYEIIPQIKVSSSQEAGRSPRKIY